jgi:membrane-bound metal-dependent hydrolase YbcI (DUF457 family)
MSNYRGHKSGALVSMGLVSVVGLSATTFGIHLDIKYIIAGAVMSFLFALFPDVDTKSTPSKYFYGMMIVVFSVLFYTKNHYVANILAIISIIPQVLKHRGILHSKITALLLPSICYYFYYNNSIPLHDITFIYVSGVFGYFMHLYLDDLL